uniref:RNA-dependent RNA polymerase n=1 Tax=Plectus sambesii TaxID=2011161 RepID=A0A914X030_9BILA
MQHAAFNDQPTIELKRTDWRLVPDVEGGALNPETDEVYCFSDGIGRVSMKAAERIAQKLEVTPVPSCFQVRFKGFKGVLTVDPQMDAEGGAECIEFRESQKKFDDPEDTSQLLEVVKYSMPSPLFLNRPLVMILDQVSRKQGRVTHERVSNGIHALLEMELNAMAEMLCCEEKSAEALFSRLPVRIDFHQLRDNGFLLTKEPFFRSLLLAIHRYNIKQQLNKAKVAIPPNLGRTMYGVMDETGMLQYGQVFIQYSPNVRAASEEVITHLGRTLVTKNPCLVPGDVRIFEAVYHPALAHLRDVIVFPRHGPRPHPDEMAGSDLDGDEYSVLFDPRLMFDRNEDAMHFPKATLRDAHCPPTTADMIAFFLTYMNMDMIGRISNAHLMAADRLGIFHPICEQIARKNAIAVDFPKTGQPAERLERDERTYRAPDFMQKSGVQPAYCSKRLVGQIFRKAKKVEDILDLGQFSVQDDSWDADLYNEAYFAQNESVKIRACAVRDQYNAKLQQLLDEYGVGDEASLVSGHMVSIKNRISEQEKEDFSFYNTDKVVELRYGRIFDSFRKEFFKEFGGEAEFVHVDASGRKSVRVNEALLNKAYAWYMVTYGPHSTGNVARFRSFPWIVWDILLQIKRRNVYGSHRATSGMRTDPLPQELAAAVDAHCVESSALMAEYRAQLMEDPATALVSLRRYCARYRCLDQLLFTVHHWAKTDGLFEQSPFRPEHLAILFLQFGLGLCETDVGNGAPASRSHYLIEQVDEMPDAAATPIDLSLSKGNFLLDFIKYLASQKFFTARCIQLREPNLCNPNSIGMLLNRPHQWRPLAAVAFKTYHHIALTGRFTALHISSAEELPTPIDAIPWDYGETFEPITVELPNAAGAMIDNQLAMGDSEIAEILKAWSKVDQIQMRRMNSSKGEQVFVSAAGKLAARQRLHRILLMDQAQLLEHLRNGNVPIAARDETL